MATPSSTLIKVIKEHCRECCLGLVSEVKQCPATNCNLWPYRNGDPNKRVLTEEERSRLAERISKVRKVQSSVSNSQTHGEEI